MKYARAAWWIFLGRLARLAHLPQRVVWEIKDQATLRMFDCHLDFEPAEIVAPVGWHCEHASITAGGGIIKQAPTAPCGCKMDPILR